MNTLVNFEIAKLLKKEGFNKPCLSHFDNKGNNSYRTDPIYGSKDVGCPNIYQVIIWFYEIHKV